MKRVETIHVTLLSSEKKIIQEAAKKVGIAPATWLRYIALQEASK